MGNGEWTRATADNDRGLVALPGADDVAAVAAAFWPNVDKSANCWRWAGRKSKEGYGIFCLYGLTTRHRLWAAHRAAWWLEHLLPIPRGRLICHHCDNPECVRPVHLFLGTRRDNVEDYAQKCRAGLILRKPMTKHAT